MRRFLVVVSLFASSVASAADTTTYTYDALGRLQTVAVSGGPAGGVASGYSYDPAGNRTSTAVTGASAALQKPQAPQQRDANTKILKATPAEAIRGGK